MRGLGRPIAYQHLSGAVQVSLGPLRLLSDRIHYGATDNEVEELIEKSLVRSVQGQAGGGRGAPAPTGTCCFLWLTPATHTSIHRIKLLIGGGTTCHACSC